MNDYRSFPDDGERRLWRYIESICRETRCDVLAVGGMPNHIHLLVNFANTISIGELMKQVKGGSSVFAAKEIRCDWFKWQAHYGACAVSPSAIPQVVAYIANQKQHHADGSIRTEWEEAYDEYEVAEAEPAFREP